jgi:hypothetical protein
MGIKEVRLLLISAFVETHCTSFELSAVTPVVAITSNTALLLLSADITV